jgi:hypothetical protein
VVGGIVTGIRTIITKTKSTMSVATLEDLQGSIEIVVFPRLYEQTAATWAEGAILLVSGRVDHRGEEVSLLADLVVPWDEAVAKGPEAFGREVAAGDRGAVRRRPNGANGQRNGGGDGGGGNGHGPGARQPVAVGPGVPTASAVGLAAVGVPSVSPLRAGVHSAPDEPVGLPAIRPADPIPTYAEPPGFAAAEADVPDEPALPDEARAAAASAAREPSRPLEAPPGGVLHVHFARAAGSDRVLAAMESFRAVMREHPGPTRVVVHVPAPGGSALPLELRGVMYDAELLAEVRRRLGDGIVDLSLG